MQGLMHFYCKRQYFWPETGGGLNDPLRAEDIKCTGSWKRV